VSLALSHQTIHRGEIKLVEFNVELLHADFGARLHGLNLSADLSDLQLRDIHHAIDTYSFLCFPNQTLSDDNQLALTSRLGVAEVEHVTLGSTGRTTYFGSVGNINDEGIQQGNQHRDTRYQSGNHLWHSDSSFRHQPSYVSIMYPYEVPGEGGATEFVSQRAAYQRLGKEYLPRNDCDPRLRFFTHSNCSCEFLPRGVAATCKAPVDSHQSDKPTEEPLHRFACTLHRRT
jgi:alpha-ketoglutarate-dependent taurine dioxygenase